MGPRIMIPPAMPIKAGKNADQGLSAARGAAVGAENSHGSGDASCGIVGQNRALSAGVDPELAEVAELWATLPDPIRQAIMALVRSSR
jgi:hypothetical protein